MPNQEPRRHPAETKGNQNGGAIPMWQVLSFSGKFDPTFFDNLHDPGPPPGELTPDQRHRTSRAVKARGRWRQANNAAWQRQRIRDGRTPRPAPLTRHQEELLVLYDNGTLLQEANEATLLSGNGCLHREDGARLNIGGSTGGSTRRALYGWAEPDVTDLFSLSER